MQSYDALTKNASEAFAVAAASGCRIFLHWCTDCYISMQDAHAANLLRGGDYVWVLSDGCGDAVSRPELWGAAQAAMIGTLCLTPASPPGAGRTALLNQWAAAGRTDAPSGYALYAHDAVLLAAHALAGTPSALSQPFGLLANQSCVPDSDAAHTAAAPWAHGAAVADAMRAVSFVGATSGSGTVALSDELERAAASYSLYNFQSDLDTITTNDGRYRMIAYVGVTGATAAPTTTLQITAPVMWSADEAINSKTPSDIYSRKVRPAAPPPPSKLMPCRVLHAKATATCRLPSRDRRLAPR